MTKKLQKDKTLFPQKKIIYQEKHFLKLLKDKPTYKIFKG